MVRRTASREENENKKERQKKERLFCLFQYLPQLFWSLPWRHCQRGSLPQPSRYRDDNSRDDVCTSQRAQSSSIVRKGDRLFVWGQLENGWGCPNHDARGSRKCESREIISLSRLKKKNLLRTPLVLVGCTWLPCHRVQPFWNENDAASVEKDIRCLMAVFTHV